MEPLGGVILPEEAHRWGQALRVHGPRPVLCLLPVLVDMSIKLSVLATSASVLIHRDGLLPSRTVN